MFRSQIVVFAWLAVGQWSFAQGPANMATTEEPPIATPGDVTPAPASAIVVPGQPRLLPDAISRQAEPGKAPEMAVEPTGIQPAQYTVPVTQPSLPTPTVLNPEPPTPIVRISVKGMETAPTGQELTYRLTVTNGSDARAHNVIARCPMPRGAKLIKALPEPKSDGANLEWQLESLDPGATRLIEVVFKPDDGVNEISVVGKVQFEHGRYITTKLANPTLQMKKVGPAQGVLHEPMTYQIVITNPGKVAVTDTQIVDSLPEGLEYVQETSNGAIPVSKVGPAPNQRTWKIGTIKPGESRTLEYRVLPRKVGDWTSEAVASATGTQAKAGCNTAIQEAKLTLQVNGPANDKALANSATPYQVMIHNTGSAVLHNVRVTLTFPSEMRVAKAANGGQMFRDAVQWVLPKLEPKQTKEVSVSLIAPSAGLRELTASARADKGLEQRKRLSVAYEGIPALNWQTEGAAVAAIGQEIVYTVTIKNPGSAPAKNVKIIADLPEQVEFRQAQPAFQRGQGGIFFNALEIPPKETVTLKIVTVARKAGEARFQFEMNAEGMSSGPLKNSKATSISPGSAPKKIDPTRVGNLPPQNLPLEEPKKIIPVQNLDPVAPISPPQ